MQQSIHLRISDILAPRDAGGEFSRPRAAEEPSVRFDDILNRQLSAEREERAGIPPEGSVTLHTEPAALQDDRMRVDREGPAGRDRADEVDGKSLARRKDEHDTSSRIDNRESDARRETVETGRRDADAAARKKAEDEGTREAMLPGTRKAPGALRDDRAALKRTGTSDDEARSKLLQRLEFVLSMPASLAEGSRELRDLKALIAEAKDLLQSRDGRTDRALMDALAGRLREFAKRIETGHAGGREARLAPLRDEIHRIADMVSRLTRKTERPGTQGRPEEGDSKQSRPAVIERVMVPHVQNGREQAESSSSRDGNSSAFSFQFSKSAQGADKQMGTAPLPRQNHLFEEQLQSLVRNAKVVVHDAKNGSFQMRLYPESLGRVNVSLGLDQGTISGRFLVETVEARQALVEQLAEIRERLAESGISVGEFQVDVRGDERYARQSAHEGPVPPVSGAPVEAGEKYEIQTVRRHDGFIDVTI